MNRKFLWRIALTTSIDAEDAVMELLAGTTGQPASSFTDAETKRVVVSVYFPRKPAQLTGLLADLKEGIGNLRRCGLYPAPAKISSARIPRERWAHSWKRHFKPLEMSALLIKPGWVRRKPRKGQAVVILDPGLSFGTGQHPTTEFCLRQLVAAHTINSKLQTRNPKLSLLDIGTGSGILAIAAAKLGFSPVHAFDFDPESVRVASANSRKNGVFARLRISRQDLTKMPLRSAIHYDVVCANLISTLLIAERRRIIARLKPGGVLILAGILANEFMTIVDSYAEMGLKLVASKAKKEWRSGAFIFANISGEYLQ